MSISEKFHSLGSLLAFIPSVSKFLFQRFSVANVMFSLFQVLFDSVVSSFHNLHHLFFVVRKLLREVNESSQKPPMNPTDDPNGYKFSSEGGFLRQPVFEIPPGSSGHLNIDDPESWDNFCCLVASSLWPSMLKCLVVGKAAIDSKSSQVRFLDITSVVAYHYIHARISTACLGVLWLFGLAYCSNAGTCRHLILFTSEHLNHINSDAPFC